MILHWQLKNQKRKYLDIHTSNKHIGTRCDVGDITKISNKTINLNNK